MKYAIPFILLVEDDPILRRILARNLEAHGYPVLQAGTFREAVEQLAVKPALLILDINLPDATGWDVAATLESISEPVPIVLISGYRPATQQLQRYRPVTFLPKPFRAEDLLAAVRKQVPAPTAALGV